MITNRDIEIAFVRAQNRINENVERAQMQIMLPDMERTAELLMSLLKKGEPKQQSNNPLTNEEI